MIQLLLTTKDLNKTYILKHFVTVRPQTLENSEFDLYGKSKSWKSTDAKQFKTTGTKDFHIIPIKLMVRLKRV